MFQTEPKRGLSWTCVGELFWTRALECQIEWHKQEQQELEPAADFM